MAVLAFVLTAGLSACAPKYWPRYWNPTPIIRAHLNEKDIVIKQRVYIPILKLYYKKVGVKKDSVLEKELSQIAHDHFHRVTPEWFFDKKLNAWVLTQYPWFVAVDLYKAVIAVQYNTETRELQTLEIRGAAMGFYRPDSENFFSERVAGWLIATNIPKEDHYTLKFLPSFNPKRGNKIELKYVADHGYYAEEFTYQNRYWDELPIIGMGLSEALQRYVPGRTHVRRDQ